MLRIYFYPSAEQRGQHTVSLLRSGSNQLVRTDAYDQVVAGFFCPPQNIEMSDMEHIKDTGRISDNQELILLFHLSALRLRRFLKH